VTVVGVLAMGCRSARSPAATSEPRHPASTNAPLAVSDRAAQRLAKAHAHYAAGVIHEMNDEHEAALQEYQQAALEDPENETLVLEVSRRFLQAKQPEKALEILKRATGYPSASGIVFARLGLVYSQLGKTELALAADRTAIKKAPKSLAGYQNLFLACLRGKQNDEALKVLDEAARQPGPDVEFLLGLADLYGSYGLQVPAQREKTNPKALAVLNRAEKLGPTSPQMRLKLADGFAALGDSQKASQVYLELLKKFPDVPLLRERVHAKLADIYLRGSEHQRAKEQLEAVIRDDPTNPQAYYWLGSIALDEKKMTEAADYLRKAILLSPDSQQAYYDLAFALIALKKGADAIATLETARKKFPQNFALEMLTGMAFSEQKGYSEALQHYTAAEVIAQATDPKRLDKTFYFQIGAAYERKGDYDQAEKYFEKCLQLAPDFSEAMNYMGYMLAEHGLKLEKARELIEKAVKAEPKNAAFLDSLGWVLFKLNQPKEALTHVLKAVELSEEPDPTLYDHLGDIYAALNQPDKAREAWRKSLSLEPSDAVRKKLEAGGGK
jgi:tetratricopeptide (TPR) repeat protein